MRKFFYIAFALAAILINGCSNESLESAKLEMEDSNKSLEFIILEDEAVAAATDFLNKGGGDARNVSNVKVETVWRNITLNASAASRSTTGNETVEVPVYVVSYTDANDEPDGYVVTVGDKRVIDRVLAFSDDGNWDTSGIPGFENLFWTNVDNSLTRTLSDSEIDMCDTYEYEEQGEIEEFAVDLLLTWGQTSSPYNDSVPACTETQNCPAGCVAVAMGQIMAHHEYPLSGSYIHQQYNRTVNATYDWAKMKASSDATLLPTTAGRSGVANILAEIGYKLGMSYGCSVSVANSMDVPDVFDAMGYTASELKEFDLQIVLDDINAGRPVYIRGSNSSSSVGHAWVVEGYKQIVNNLIYGRDCPDGGGESIPPTIIGYSVQSNYLYFNLGWNGVSNGYYLADTFNDWDYPSGSRIIYNIQRK